MERDLVLRSIDTVKSNIKHLTMRDMLDLIDLFLDRRDQESANLAAVITALRGDDRDNKDHGGRMKSESTCVIRAAALPIVCKPDLGGYGSRSISVGTDDALCMGVLTDRDVNPSVVVLRGDRYGHFNTHLRIAAFALDLGVEFK